MKNSRTSTNKNTKNTSSMKKKSSTSPSRTAPVKKNTAKPKTVSKPTVKRKEQIYIEDEVYNSNRNIINNKITEKDIEEKPKKRRIRAITILKLAFFIGIICGFAYLCFTLETFNLDNIQIEGNVKYEDNYILDNLELKIGENVFKQLIFAKRKAENLSYISKMKFNYSFPSTIVVNVEERYPLYISLDKNSGKYYKIDNEGYLLEECKLEDKKDEIIVEGFSFEENPTFGKQINDIYISKLNIYNNIKNMLEEYNIGGKITRANFANSLTIVTLDDKLNIVFANDTNLNYKVSFLKGILEQSNGVDGGTIDMSIDNPVYSKYD